MTTYLYKGNKQGDFCNVQAIVNRITDCVSVPESVAGEFKARGYLFAWWEKISGGTGKGRMVLIKPRKELKEAFIGVMGWDRLHSLCPKEISEKNGGGFNWVMSVETDLPGFRHDAIVGRTRGKPKCERYTTDADHPQWWRVDYDGYSDWYSKDGNYHIVAHNQTIRGEEITIYYAYQASTRRKGVAQSTFGNYFTGSARDGFNSLAEAIAAAEKHAADRAA